MQLDESNTNDTDRRTIHAFASSACLSGDCQLPAGGSSGQVGRDQMPAVLWIDDDADDVFVRWLALEGFHVDYATTGRAGLQMARAHEYAAYIVDLSLPDVYGLSVLERLIGQGSGPPTVVLTGRYTEPESERQAKRLGAVEFWFKPMTGDEVAQGLRRVLASRRPESGSAAVPPPPYDGTTTSGVPPIRFGIVAASQAMQDVIAWIDRVGPPAMPVLLHGETGTGKELVARALHARSPRARSPFVAVNCGAIPDGLRETELFGHCRGAFTGAIRDRKGLIEQAGGGTLFLDEIAETPLSVQIELLRVLEDGEVRPVGAARTRRVDVRVVAATNGSLVEQVRQGRFRDDLYYRLIGAVCHLPPLRERPEDIDALIRHWLAHGVGPGVPRVVSITPAALEALRRHPWPGNVRELRHVFECALWLAATDQLAEGDILAVLSQTSRVVRTPAIETDGYDEARRTMEALERSHWNHSLAARLLGVNRSTLWRRLRKYRAGHPDST